MADQDLPLYRDSGRDYLQLHDHHTMWKITNEHVDENVFNMYVEGAVDLFKEKFNEQIYGLGRSGRHICVENTDRNRRRYKSMKRYALKLEKDVIKMVNKYKPAKD